MKIPYIKIYTSDLLAIYRRVTDEQLGRAVVGICEQAFENETDYLPQTPPEERMFALLTQWKAESQKSYLQNKRASQKAAWARWQKKPVSDGASRIITGHSQLPCQTETDTETETNTDTETKTENINTLTALAEATQGERIFSSLQDETSSGMPRLVE